MRQVSATIEFGTSKVVCTIAEKGVYEGFSLLGAASVPYSGFSAKGWRDQEELQYVISAAIHEAEKQAGVRVKYLNIGVPASFTHVVCKKVGLAFGKAHRITQSDVNLLFKRGENFSSLHHCTIAHRCPIYFTINDERKTMEPVGQMAEKLGAYVSYILVQKGFLNSVVNYLHKEGCEIETAVSSVFAQGMAYIPLDDRDKTAILIDIGERLTSVSVFKGDGILYNKAFAVGGWQITKDLAITMNINDDIAEQLKCRAVYGLSVSRDDRYELTSTESYKLMRFPVNQVQDIIVARLSEIFSVIKRDLASSGCLLPEFISVYFSGGVSSMRGIRELMQKQLGRNVVLIQPKSTKLNQPCYTAALGVTNLVMERFSIPAKSLWEQIKAIFKK